MPTKKQGLEIKFLKDGKEVHLGVSSLETLYMFKGLLAMYRHIVLKHINTKESPVEKGDSWNQLPTAILDNCPPMTNNL